MDRRPTLFQQDQITSLKCFALNDGLGLYDTNSKTKCKFSSFYFYVIKLCVLAAVERTYKREGSDETAE